MRRGGLEWGYRARAESGWNPHEEEVAAEMETGYKQGIDRISKYIKENRSWVSCCWRRTLHVGKRRKLECTLWFWIRIGGVCINL